MKKIALMAAALAIAPASFAENVVVAEEAAAPAYADAFSGFYLGLGIGGSFMKCTRDNPNVNEKCNRFIGTVVLGGGKAINQKFYVGGEFLMDFTKSKTKNVTVDNAAYELKYQGVTPQLALRLGYANPCWGALFYGKAGVAFNKGKVRAVANNTTYSKTKAGFVLGLGAEKAFCKKFSARLEADYNFGGKEDSIKFNKGFTIRALAAYNINF